MNGSSSIQQQEQESWHVRFYRELTTQMKTAGPSMLSMVLYKIPWLLSLRFVGNIGPEELAAAALATTLCNVTGLSLSVGLSSALSTFTGQARGDLMAQEAFYKASSSGGLTVDSSDETNGTTITHEKKKETFLQDLANNEKTKLLSSNLMQKSQKDLPEFSSLPIMLPLVYLYRGMFIQILIVLPVGLWWLYGIKPVLLALGQQEDLSIMTESYLRVLTPGLWSYSMNWTLSVWLQTIEMADIPAYTAFVGLVLHVPMNLLFIHGFKWGYLGVGAATVMFQLVQPILTVVYMFGTKRGSKRVLESLMGGSLDGVVSETIANQGLPFRKEAKMAISSISGVCQYLSLAIPGILIISEWWASEVAIFLAGRLKPSPALALDGMAIYQSINSFCFMLPVGVSVAGATRLGNLLGLGDVEGAAFAAKTNLATATLASVAMGSILYLVPHSFFPSIFSPDQEVVVETSRTIPLLALYVIADGIQAAVNGVVRGCGRQCITMPIVLVAYWVVGIPLAYHVAFVQFGGYMCDNNYFCGIVGLVAGMTAGTFLHLLLLSIAVLGTTNWTIEAQKAKTRLALERKTRESEASPVLQHR